MCIVQTGDTLSELAIRFNVTVNELLRADPIAAPEKLQAGQTLAVPCSTLIPPPPCHPAYPDVCIPFGSLDWDCDGGSGDGPNFIIGPFRVLPPDPYDLDGDGNGIGCGAGDLTSATPNR